MVDPKTIIAKQTVIIDEFMSVLGGNRHFHNYRKDWGALMWVVEKIESIKLGDYTGFTFESRRNHVVIHCHFDGRQNGVVYQTPFDPSLQPENRQEATYQAVVGFVEWYNTNLAFLDKLSKNNNTI